MFEKGYTPWNKGIIGGNSGSFKKGLIPWNKGKKTGPLSKAHRLKLSLSHRGVKKSKEHARKVGLAHKGEKSHWWKGGRYKQRGYILILLPNHPFANAQGYIREHRVVMEKTIGRFLTPIEVVNHLNGIKNDNRPENLVLCSSNGEHIRKFHGNKNR